MLFSRFLRGLASTYAYVGFPNGCRSCASSHGKDRRLQNLSSLPRCLPCLLFPVALLQGNLSPSSLPCLLFPVPFPVFSSPLPYCKATCPPVLFPVSSSPFPSLPRKVIPALLLGFNLYLFMYLQGSLNPSLSVYQEEAEAEGNGIGTELGEVLKEAKLTLKGCFARRSLLGFCPKQKHKKRSSP
jgi:hypothetical protein